MTIYLLVLMNAYVFGSPLQAQVDTRAVVGHFETEAACLSQMDILSPTAPPNTVFLCIPAHKL